MEETMTTVGSNQQLQSCNFAEEAKTMTTKEVAEALGVSVQTIKNYTDELFPGKSKQGVATTFTEAEVAQLSMKAKHIQSNFKSTFEVTNASTELEIMLNAAKVMQQLQDLVRQKELEVQQLQIELDKSKEWYSVKRVTIEDGREFPWRPLKKYSDEHGYEVKKVFDQNYGEVNAYHIDVWHKVYGVEL